MVTTDRMTTLDSGQDQEPRARLSTSDRHRKERARYLVENDYRTAAEFARISGISKARVSQILSDYEPFGESAARTWEEALDLPYGWFSNDWPTPKEADRHGWRIDRLSPLSNRNSIEDFVQIRHASVKFSNGHGIVAYDEGDKPPLSFRLDFLRKLGVPTDKAIVVEASGNSNEPRIMNGSVVLVNAADKERLDGGFFAFRADGKLLIKRLEILYGIGVIATADNTDFKPRVKIYKDGVDDFEVIGRAVWTGALL